MTPNDLPAAFSSRIIQATAFAVRVARSVAPWIAAETFLVPPATAGSLGDQSILQGVLDALPQARRRRVRQLLMPGFEPQQIKERPDTKTLPLALNSRRWILAFLVGMIRCRHFVVLGADVMDGRYDLNQALTYLRACRLAAVAGVPARIAGFSFSENPHPAAVGAMRTTPSSVEFCLRDAVSMQRFTAATGSAPTLVADAAFLMEASAGSQSAREAIAFCQSARAQRAILIGVNLNPLVMVGRSDQSIQAYAAALRAILSSQPEIRLVMIPHDIRPQQDDGRALVGLAGLLGPNFRSRIFLMEPPNHAWDVRAVVRELDLVVTGRMHLAISALSQTVPALGVAYMGKFEGLMKHFSLEAMFVSPDEMLEAGRLSQLITKALRDRAGLAEAIHRALPGVTALARGNVRGMS